MLICVFLILMVSTLAIHPIHAQDHAAPFDSTELKSTYIFAGIGGFIPLHESYRINYSTKVAGLPIELVGGLLFPFARDMFVPLTVRYVRREANFVDGTSIGVISLEPGVRMFL